MTSTPTRMPIWRPASPQPLGSLAVTLANARDTRQSIVIRGLTATKVRPGDLETTEQATGAGDPRPAAGDVRAAGQRAAPAADRRADQDGALPAHQRPQPRPRVRGAARALPHLGGGPGRTGRGGGGRDPPRWPGAAEGAADPGDPRAARRGARPRLDRDGAAR